MLIPPRTKRTFITKHCVVKDRCEDSSPRYAIQNIGTTCADIEGHRLNIDPDVCTKNSHLQLYCPTACGVCINYVRKPNAVVGIFYHAHLLGREMYATIKKNADGRVIDVKSQPHWNYDNQKIYHIQEADNITVESGDEIQVSCVYDSSDRENPTRLGQSTYDEMCIHNFQTIHKTEDIKYAEVGMFRCEGNVTMGTLEDNESGFSIGSGLHTEMFSADIWNSDISNSVNRDKFDVAKEKLLVNYYSNESSCTMSDGSWQYDPENFIGRGAFLVTTTGKHEDKVTFSIVAKPGTSLDDVSLGYQKREWICGEAVDSLIMKHSICRDPNFLVCEPSFAINYPQLKLPNTACQTYLRDGEAPQKFSITFGDFDHQNLCKSEVSMPINPNPTHEVLEIELSGAQCPSGSPDWAHAQAAAVNTVYKYAGETADGRPYYKSPFTEMYVYYDKKCADYMESAWLVSPVKPSLVAEERVQYGPGGGRGPGTPESHMTDCNNAVNFPSFDWKLPIGVKASFLWCGSVSLPPESLPTAKVVKRNCCEAMTKECLACKNGISVLEFCKGNLGKFGCSISSQCTSEDCCGLGTEYINGKCVSVYAAISDACHSTNSARFNCVTIGASDPASCR